MDCPRTQVFTMRVRHLMQIMLTPRWDVLQTKCRFIQFTQISCLTLRLHPERLETTQNVVQKQQKQHHLTHHLSLPVVLKILGHTKLLIQSTQPEFVKNRHLPFIQMDKLFFQLT